MSKYKADNSKLMENAYEQKKRPTQNKKRKKKL